MMKLAPELAEQEDVARKAKILMKSINAYQKSLSWLELCKKPVLAAIHSACVGGGVDLVTVADMRYCTKDAWFQVKEVDIGMAADVGTLQRLPKVIGSDSLARELCYTARKMPAAEALSSGLVSRVFEDKDSMIKGVVEIAEEISKKSPVAVQGTKVSIVFGRDHSVQEGLNQIGLWNQLMLQSEDFMTATVAQATKQTDVVFSKL
jgi:delta(3,5)-delta(2,4)-dienoyl-CoA isomerase